MDTNRLKRFAVEARNLLMPGVRNRLQTLGFDLTTGQPTEMPQPIEGGATYMGKTMSWDFYRRWMSLYYNVCNHGLKHVAEEAAYTWFNRLVAIRIMQKQGFISPVLAYESDEVHVPVIVSEARRGHLPQLAPEVREQLMELLDDDSKTDEQFSLLIVAYCHDNPIINQCFGSIADYTELLLPQNILVEGGFVSLLNELSSDHEEDFRSAELIGWLYQFYISDRKAEAFAKKGKYDADEIAPATQIFTPNWIVKYMVENTVGRIYADNNPYCEAKDHLKYLVDTPQDAAVPSVDDLANLTVADLACGSGHILNECFELLYRFYMEEGYSRVQAITHILRRNLLGIDLDTRAKQLATFALLMKACQKDTTFLDGRVMPRVYDMPHPLAEALTAEGDGRTAEEYLRDALPHYLQGDDADRVKELTDAILLINHADTLGSIMQFRLAEPTREALLARTEEYETQLAKGENVPADILLLLPYMRIILALTQKYTALCMNPPYMGSGRFDEVLSKYVKKHYEAGKADLFSVFMLMGMERLAQNGKMAQINMQSWMFLSSFEKLRTQLLTNYNIDSMLHLGPRTFDELSGEVVQNTAFVLSKHAPASQGGTYYRLVDGKNCADKEQLFLSHIRDNSDAHRIYYPNVAQKNFEKIPGEPIGYWVSEKIKFIFKNNTAANDVISLREGIHTGKNELFLRYWTEVNAKEIVLNARSEKDVDKNGKWVPYNKGGSPRKWFGNNDLVVRFDEKGRNDMASMSGHVRPSQSLYFKEGATWSALSSGSFALRYYPSGFLFDSKGQVAVGDKCFEILTSFNTKIYQVMANIIMPTLDYKCGDVKKLPYTPVTSDLIATGKSNITLSRLDWDAHETSWDFEESPLMALANPRVKGEGESVRMEDLVAEFEADWTEKFMQLHTNEEQLNREFINIYGLEDELSPDVPLSEITILQQGEISIEKE